MSVKTDAGRFLGSLRSISPPDWRHLWRHLPHLDSMFIPKIQLVHSPLNDPLEASMTPDDWAFMTDEAATQTRLDCPDHVSLEKFLTQAYRLAFWLAEQGELQMVSIEGKRLGNLLPLYTWAGGEQPDHSEEMSFYESQSDAENPHRHLIAGQALLRRRQAAGMQHVERALAVPQTRQRAMYAKGALFTEHLNQPIIEQEDKPGSYFARLEHDRAAAFLWGYGGFLEDPEEAKKLGWQDEHLLMLDALTSEELATIYEVLETGFAPPGISPAEVKILFLDQDEATSGVRTLKALRAEQEKSDPEWYQTLQKIRDALDSDTKH